MNDDDYLDVSIDRDDESLTDWWREILTRLGVFLYFLLHVTYIEKVIKAAVFICDQVKHEVAFLLIGIDVMENHESVRKEFSAHCHPCLSVDYVEQSL